MSEIRAPEWTESTAEEGFVANWFVHEGDQVKVGQVLGEIMVEKATIEIAAPSDGTLGKVLVERGDVVHRGALLAEIVTAPQESQAGSPTATSEPVPTVPTAAAIPSAFVPASPAARRLARELGVELSQVKPADGTRVTEEDVRRAAGSAATKPDSRKAAPAGEPLQGLRRAIAERLLKGVQQSAQLTLTTDVDASTLIQARDRLKDRIGATYTDLLSWVVLRALEHHPHLNATLDSQNVLTRYDRVHLGLAVSVDQGLLVPVVRDASALSFPDFVVRAHEAIERARNGGAAPDELSGSTFSVTTLGAYDIDAFTPLLNPPEVGILGIGRVRETVVPRAGQPAVGHMIVLSLTFDHRAIDGAPAAAFLQEVKRMVETVETFGALAI